MFVLYTITNINPFFPNASFLYPLKTSENLTFFWCFHGVEKGCTGKKLVNKVDIFHAFSKRHQKTLYQIKNFHQKIDFWWLWWNWDWACLIQIFLNVLESFLFMDKWWLEITWSRVTWNNLNSFSFMPNVEIILANTPKRHRNIKTLIKKIDCWTTFIETLQNLELQKATCSDYNHHNIIKFLKLNSFVLFQIQQ